MKFKEIVHKKVFGDGFVDTEFLSYWEKEKEKIKLATKGSGRSVQVLTIHKSKGLEFPIVIYPFADSETYRNSSTKKWLPFSEEKDSFNLLIPFSEGIKEYSSAFFDEYGLHIENQEFDNLNLLFSKPSLSRFLIKFLTLTLVKISSSFEGSSTYLLNTFFEI